MMNERSSNSLEYALWRNPGARISGSMYHEGNPGARISGSMCHEGTLGAQISYEYVFFWFLPKKPGARCMHHEPKIIKNPGKIVICTIPQDFPSPRFFWKKRQKRKKTIASGARMSLEHEFPWSTNFLSSNVCSGNPWGPNLFLCAGKILVRKPPRKTVASKPQQFVPSRE